MKSYASLPNDAVTHTQQTVHLELPIRARSNRKLVIYTYYTYLKKRLCLFVWRAHNKFCMATLIYPAENGRTYFPTNKTHFIIRFLGMILKVRIYTCYISGLYTYMIIYGYIYIYYIISLSGRSLPTSPSLGTCFWVSKGLIETALPNHMERSTYWKEHWSTISHQHIPWKSHE